jgi:hypothetical protein
MKTLIQLTASFAVAAAVLLTANHILSAHAELEGAVPAPNATLTTAPKQIKLVFSEALQAAGNRITLRDARKAKVAIGKTARDPSDSAKKTLIASVPDKLPVGEYTVEWKNLSVDGHSEKGSYTFFLAAPAAWTDPAIKVAVKAGKESEGCGKGI